MLQKFDRLSMPYEQYFGEMEITDDQKKKRIQVAEEIEDIMFFLYELVSLMTDYRYISPEFIKQKVYEKYINVLEKHGKPDKYIEEYAKEFSDMVVDTTIKHAGEDSDMVVDTTIKHAGEEFYRSEDRAMLVAENEANSAINYFEYKEAVAGGKKRKQWITQRDDRVRDTHKEVNGETIPIDNAFIVGDSLMAFPKDTSYGASINEIAGCRCTIKYF